MSADFTPKKEDYKILTPFKMQVLTNFPYIEADFDALTNYQLLCKVVEYLNGVIHNENEVTEQVNSLYNAYVSLQNYVNNYFDNLDVQEEINNKLDEMVEQGTLQEIITTYIQSNVAWTFNNVNNMKQATNLVNGSFAQTLGFYNINDGGSSLYKIRELEEDETANEMDIISLNDETLVAELVINNEINIKCLGAKGDNNNDDTNMIQRSLDLAKDNKYNVIIPKGEYKITDNINIYDNITIIGCGNNSIIHQTSQYKNIFQCFTTIDNLLIKDIYLYGVDAPDLPTESERSCLMLCGCTNSKFINIKFGKSDDSHISLRYSVNQSNEIQLSNNNLIENCEFTNCSEGSPIELFFATKNIITNCYFHDNNIESTRWSIRMLQATDTLISKCKFNNEYISIVHANGVGGDGLYPKIQSNNLVIDSCEFIDSRHADIMLKGSNEIITNCIFKNKSNIAGVTAIQMNYQNDDELIESICKNRQIVNNLFDNYQIPLTINDYNEDILISNNYFTNKSTLSYDRMLVLQLNNINHCSGINITNNYCKTYNKKLNLTRTLNIDETEAKHGTIMNNVLYTGGEAVTRPLLYAANNNYYIDGNINNYESVTT